MINCIVQVKDQPGHVYILDKCVLPVMMRTSGILQANQPQEITTARECYVGVYVALRKHDNGIDIIGEEPVMFPPEYIERVLFVKAIFEHSSYLEKLYQDKTVPAE